MNTFAPIALFAYNRLDHLRQTVQCLSDNILASESDLIIFADASKNEMDRKSVIEVRSFLKTILGFNSVSIIHRDKNYGLAKSIIEGVTSVINKYGKIIVVEDDLITSKYFLQYMNESLDLYKNEEKVISIHGYVYPVQKTLPQTFFIYGADCWGWATWKRGWDLFEKDAKKLLYELEHKDLLYRFDWNGSYPNTKMLKNQISGKINSWAIRWHASALLKNKLTLYPGISLVNNIGGDIFATHTKSLKLFQTEVAQKPIQIVKLPIEENIQAYLYMTDFFRSIKRNLFQKIKEKFSSK